jgi:hypothetical protein
MDKLFDLIKETKDNIQNAPSEYPVNLILTGQDAARTHFLVSLYTSYFEKFTEEDIIKYLLRQTVLQEISKLSDYEQIQQPSDNNQS